MSEDCVFCRIVRHEVPAAVIYEDDDFIAFLDINPACEGQSLVIPKKHYEYAFDMNDHNYEKLLVTAKHVAKLLDKALKPKRTCLVIEGFDVPHVHVKLYPVKEGFLKLYPTKKATKEELEKLSDKIRGFL